MNFEATKRAKFHSLMRHTNQPMRDFVLQLQTQASRCNFGSELQTQLRDRLIAGINCPELQQRLLLLQNCTFPSAKAACEQFQDVRSAVSEDPQVLFSSNNSRRSSSQRTRPFKRPLNQNPRVNNIEFDHDQNSQQWSECESCGSRHSRLTCKFRSAKCHKCGKTGHIQSVCKSTKACLTERSSVSESLVSDFQTLALTSSSSQPSCHITREFLVNKSVRHSFILDTGSVVSFIPYGLLQHMQPTVTMSPTNISVKGITGHSLPVLGTCDFFITDDRCNTFKCPFLVTDSSISIIGLNCMKLMHISLSCYSDSHQCCPRRLILDCSRATGGISMTPVYPEVTGSPVCTKRRILPTGLREPVKKVLDDSVSKGIHMVNSHRYTFEARW